MTPRPKLLKSRSPTHVRSVDSNPATSLGDPARPIANRLAPLTMIIALEEARTFKMLMMSERAVGLMMGIEVERRL